jgi:hypothetical protein
LPRRRQFEDWVNSWRVTTRLTAGNNSQELGREEITVVGLLLAAPGEKGNEAFLGIGVIGWIIIIAIVLVAAYLFTRSRGRRGL